MKIDKNKQTLEKCLAEMLSKAPEDDGEALFRNTQTAMFEFKTPPSMQRSREGIDSKFLETYQASSYHDRAHFVDGVLDYFREREDDQAWQLRATTVAVFMPTLKEAKLAKAYGRDALRILAEDYIIYHGSKHDRTEIFAKSHEAQERHSGVLASMCEDPFGARMVYREMRELPDNIKGKIVHTIITKGDCEDLVDALRSHQFPKGNETQIVKALLKKGQHKYLAQALGYPALDSGLREQIRKKIMSVRNRKTVPGILRQQTLGVEDTDTLVEWLVEAGDPKLAMDSLLYTDIGVSNELKLAEVVVASKDQRMIERAGHYAKSQRCKTYLTNASRQPRY